MWFLGVHWKSTKIYIPAEHWLVRVTERCKALGESPGSNPKLRVPTCVGQTVDEWVEEAEEADDEAEEELTEIIEWGLFPTPFNSPIVDMDPERRRGAAKKASILAILSMEF